MEAAKPAKGSVAPLGKVGKAASTGKMVAGTTAVPDLAAEAEAARSVVKRETSEMDTLVEEEEEMAAARFRKSLQLEVAPVDVVPGGDVQVAVAAEGDMTPVDAKGGDVNPAEQREFAAFVSHFKAETAMVWPETKPCPFEAELLSSPLQRPAFASPCEERRRGSSRRNSAPPLAGAYFWTVTI